VLVVEFGEQGCGWGLGWYGIRTTPVSRWYRLLRTEELLIERRVQNLILYIEALESVATRNQLLQQFRGD